MKRWWRLFLASMEDWHRRFEDRQNYEYVHEFTFGTVPRMLLEWHEFAGARVHYDLPTGVLEIEMQTDEDMLEKAMHREKVWDEREEAIAKSNLLVGDWLSNSPKSYEGDLEEGELPGGTTKRLKKARQRAVDEGSLADQQWLGLDSVMDDEAPPVQYRPPQV